MGLSAGNRLGWYEIVAPLGAGGMGEVYRARDTRLARDVAIKVLPETFASDPERLVRFEREARVLASLNHPHIAAIYGVEETNGVRALVLELVEGPTIEDRLRTGAIPLKEALPIARQIADALDAAHEKGIVHRDLKPSNIKLTASGTVKVLDFGIAKLSGGGSGRADPTESLTTIVGGTGAGVVLGTVAYMSPEQARGLPVDKRTDVWAFGCVLYEMLTGRPAFARATVPDTIAAILEGQPDWAALPPAAADATRRVLARCLEKDPKRRLRDIADTGLELEDVAATSSIVAATAPANPRARRLQRLAWPAAATLFALAAAAAALWNRDAPAPLETRLEIATPASTDPVSLAISPDARAVAFVATDEGRSRLWIRRLDAVAPRVLRGTDGAYQPFWSPDGKALGFFADGKLKRIDLETTSVQILADASAGRGGAWNRDGVIFYAPQAGPIFRIAAAGGERTQVTTPDTGRRTSHRFPQFLSDGRHFLYYVQGAPDARGVYVAQVDGSEPRRVVEADVAAVLTGSGQLLFVRQGTLFAQPFDDASRTVRGAPVPIASQLIVNVPFGIGAISASSTGAFIYRSGPAERRQFIWFDRSGREAGGVGEVDSSDPSYPALSPDGRELAFSREEINRANVWLLETSRGLLRRLTSGSENDRAPLWTLDGSRLVFSSARQTGRAELYQKRISGTGDEERLLSMPDSMTPADFSPDGRYFLFRTQNVKTRYDIWAVRLKQQRAGDALAIAEQPRAVLQTEFDERDAQFSPDGKWIAYESDESGRFEVYVQPFPGPGLKRPVSTNGGAQVRWPRQGMELFYIGLDNRLMAVPIRLDAARQQVEADAPIPLFTTRVGGAVTVRRQQYVVSPDGQRFLMNVIKEDAGSAPITVVQNWNGSAR